MRDDESIGTKSRNLLNDVRLKNAIKKVQVSMDSKCKLTGLMSRPYKYTNLSAGFIKKTGYESLKALGSTKRAELQAKSGKSRIISASDPKISMDRFSLRKRWRSGLVSAAATTVTLDGPGSVSPSIRGR